MWVVHTREIDTLGIYSRVDPDDVDLAVVDGAPRASRARSPPAFTQLGLATPTGSHIGACAAQTGNWRRSPTVTSARAAQRARRRPALLPPPLNFPNRRWSTGRGGPVTGVLRWG